MILVFNKTDVKDAEFAREWMTDFEAFQAALREEEEAGSFGGVEGGQSGITGGSGYMGSLLNSMSLMLEEFYKHLNVVGVSSMTGQGVDEFFKAIDEKVEEFEREYRPELEKRRKQREKQKIEARDDELGRLLRDMNVSGPTRTRPRREEPETVSDVEDDNEEDIPAEMVEPDDEEMQEDEDEDEREGAKEAGLTGKYKQALAAEGAGHQSASEDDLSFARYVRSSGMNR